MDINIDLGGGAMDRNDRVSSVDIGRGLAILCMISAHFSVTFWLINNYGNILAAPFFLFISGISFEFFVNSRIRRKMSQTQIFFESFSKSIFIYTLPLIPYVIIWLVDSAKYLFYPVHWGVFQVIAIGYLAGFFMYRDWRAKVLSIGSIFIITLVVQTYYPQIFGFLLSDIFPVLPWLAYFIMGQLIYEMYKFTSISSEKWLLCSVIIVIPCFIIFKMDGIPFDSSLRTHFSLFLLLSGIFLVIQSIVMILADRLHRCQRLFSPLERVGKIAFTSYYLQFPLLFIGMLVITKYHLSSLFVIPFIIVIMGILAIIEKYWEKYDFRFGFEWAVRKGSGGVYRILSRYFSKEPEKRIV
jgi:hypothetical protein